MTNKTSKLSLVKFNKANLSQGRHILIVESFESRRAVALNTTVFSIGRHPSNALMLSSNMVSRHHATIAWLKYTIKSNNSIKDNYCYWIIDGKGKRKRSRNGIYVNGEKKLLHRLESGDLITIGKEIKITYNYISYSSQTRDFIQYCDTAKPQYYSQKEHSYKETMIFDQRITPNPSDR